MSKREVALAESMVTAPSAFAPLNAERPVLLNRMAYNPEIVFNPTDPFGRFDAQMSERWFVVDSCFYCKRHRYTQVFWNQADVQDNDFKVLQGQEMVMRIIDHALRKKDQVHAKSPVIIAGGRAHEMIDARIYGSMLWLNEIVEEATAQRMGASVEMTMYPAQVQANMSPQQKQMQDSCTKALASLTEADVRTALCDLAAERLTCQDICLMNETQQKIAAAFE